MIEMHFHIRTDDEPWRAECRAYGLRSDTTKGTPYDLCRQLIALGVEDGPAVVYRNGKPACRISSVAEAAKWTILENEHEGPRLVRWKAFSWRSGQAPVRESRDAGIPAPENAHANSDVEPPTGIRRAA